MRPGSVNISKSEDAYPVKGKSSWIVLRTTNSILTYHGAVQKVWETVCDQCSNVLAIHESLLYGQTRKHARWNAQLAQPSLRHNFFFRTYRETASVQSVNTIRKLDAVESLS